ncbi:hypothetical protein B5C34_13745 [Pacificimonas flava]|uniref:N-acetyltransferase domain-containing protein n=2 Tax=Pacificimonas TaxID=1960290 RepID=A0A219B8F8_9SPHN|nr:MULTISPECIES: GNAT family N-acetyltransferase [Pacificimonas]MBZ6379888.1 GNAT family N-acetyltransferase [Pacificimonas aurantium]OWV34416.1 hypothetical protein B5C34_13745 [Pacificimonas flava]
MIRPEPLPASVRPAGRRDLGAMADILGDAFAGDPFNLWLMGKPAAIRAGFRELLRDLYLPHGQCFLAEGGGAAAWIDSRDMRPFSALGLLRWSLSLMWHGQFGGGARGAAAGEAMEAAHPEEPHLYLFLIGTAGRARGRGLGKDLMAPMLAACDRDGLPCYLESSDPENFGFYRAHGFDFRGEPIVVSGVSPLLTPMWRDPR